MARLKLTLACWDYDRTRALADGSVRPEGIDLVYLPLPVEETFFRMLRSREFHCAEMSLSSYVMTLGAVRPPFVAIPAFPSRFFRHSCIFVSAKIGIQRPEDLTDKRIGVPEYQMTAAVWIRGILADEYDVPPDGVDYFSGGLEEPGPSEKLALDLPPRIKVSPIGKRQTLAKMLAEGKLDALYSARAPSTLRTRPGDVRRLFPDYVTAEREYFRRSKIFPIMHTVVIRRDLYDKHAWVAQSLYKAFLASQNGEIVELRCTHDPATRGGGTPGGRKVQGTIHWVAAADAVDCEVRLYDHLFASPDPDAVAEGVDWLATVDPGSLEIVAGAKVEPALATAAPGERVQFERIGYFVSDVTDHSPTRPVFNRTVTLRDSWAKIQKQTP